MARGKIGKLKASQLKTKTAGMKSDGGNLYLRSWEAKDGTLTRGWIFRFKLPFKNERDIGLGSLDSINLAKARELAAQYREMVAHRGRSHRTAQLDLPRAWPAGLPRKIAATTRRLR